MTENNKKIINRQKILFTTEKLNLDDTIFAFSHLWIKTMSEQVERLTVIALSVGRYDLPRNVKVYSLGKEKYSNKNKIIQKIIYLFNFYKFIIKESKNYDTVFIHMNQQNVLLGAIWWKFTGKKIGLWYTHRQVSWSLSLAVKIADYVFTAAHESMNVKTDKKYVIGHGLQTKNFINKSRIKALENKEQKIKIVSIGRITPIKNLEYLIRAGKILKDKNYKIEIKLIGPEVNDADKEYRKKLNQEIEDLNLSKDIIFLGGKSPSDIKEELWNADMHVNLCPTGGLDKAVIEAACAGTHSLCANDAFRLHFGGLADNYIFKFQDIENLADKIEDMIKMPKEESQKLVENLQLKFIDKFDVSTLINKILNIYKDK